MCLAWNRLRSYVQDKHLDFFTTNPSAQKSIHNFNHSLFTQEDIDDKSVYVNSGFGQAIQKQINKEVKMKFPLYSFPDLDFSLQDKDVLSFAYLYKQLTFP